MLQKLVKLLSDEADRNPKFADELDALLSPLPTSKPRRKPEQQGPLSESLPDIHTEYSTKGESGFRLWLRDQPIKVLRALIRAHDFDARRRTAKWKNGEQLSEFITEQLRARLARGSGFLSSGMERLKKELEDAPRSHEFLSEYVRELELHRNEEDIFIRLAFQNVSAGGAYGRGGTFVTSAYSEIYDQPLDVNQKRELRRWWHDKVQREAERHEDLHARLAKVSWLKSRP